MAQEAAGQSASSKSFANRIARSIAEIQSNVNNMADVVVLLEVLGYNDNDAKKHGFENLEALGRYVYDFVDAYEEKEIDWSAGKLAVSSKTRRLKESLTMMFPWIGSLVLLAVAGVSLWMAWGLPAAVTTAFLAGVFTGLAITEGMAQNLHRLFSFYYSQTNVGEVRRSIKRNYALAGAILSVAVALVYLAAENWSLPVQLASIATIGMVTISLHRLSYVVLYAMKKLRQIAISYSIAFAVVLGLFYLLQPTIPDVTARYLAALGSAFAVLSGFAAYYHHRLLAGSTTAIVARNAPHFYSPLTVNDKTLTSRYSVQLWESLPYFLYGSCYFIIIFADRILSWIFNPHTVTASNGAQLPLAFNSVYHAGADLALLIIIPVAILQYILTEPIYAMAHNKAIRLRVREIRKVDLFIRRSYAKTLVSTLVVSISVAALLSLVVGPAILERIGGNEVSHRILMYASAGAVMLSVFAANAIFMIFLGRTKELAIISILAAATVIAGGVIMAVLFGFEKITLGYLAGTTLAAITSSIVMSETLKKAASRLFARYV